MKCEECKYWKEAYRNFDDSEKDFGQCRKYAPNLIVSGCGTGDNPEYSRDWADTKPDDWCGEFEAKAVPVELPTWTDMCWSVHCRKTLEKAGISSVAELTSKRSDELLRLRNFGLTSLREVEHKLGKLNLALKQ